MFTVVKSKSRRRTCVRGWVLGVSLWALVDSALVVAQPANAEVERDGTPAAQSPSDAAAAPSDKPARAARRGRKGRQGQRRRDKQAAATQSETQPNAGAVTVVDDGAPAAQQEATADAAAASPAPVSPATDTSATADSEGNLAELVPVAPSVTEESVPTPEATDPLSIPPGTAPQGPVAPAFPPAIPSIDYGARLRTGLVFQDPVNPSSLGDVGMTVDTDVYFSGQLHTYIKWMASFTLSYGNTPGAPSSVSPQLLDATAMFELMPELNVYAGRMLVPADRYTQSGPWTIDAWYYPGFFTGGPFGTPPAVPQAGVPAGREVGVNVWGAPLGGHLKYYAGIYRLQDPAVSPLLSGRIQVSLLSPEPYWFQRTALYGDKELLSFGLSAQYQVDGSVGPAPIDPMTGSPGAAPLSDYNGFSLDAIVEKRVDGWGGLSGEAAAYMFNGDFSPWASLFLVGAGFTFDQVIGIGRIRPSFRLQRGQRRTPDGAPELGGSLILDVQVSYVIMNWYARVSLGFRHISDERLNDGQVESGTGNQVFLGVTLWDP